MASVLLDYQDSGGTGLFQRVGDLPESVWIRLRSAALALDPGTRYGAHSIQVEWRSALEILRLNHRLQTEFNFRFTTSATAKWRVEQFMREYRVVRAAADGLRANMTVSEASERLADAGWNAARHELKPYQLENLLRLLQLSHGANFSVPGAGKTTVTFALHLLATSQADCVLVVCPGNAFPAWEEVIDECLLPTASAQCRESFIPLVGGEGRIAQTLAQGGRRFIISYGQLVWVESVIKELLSTRKVHLILDESHRMKAGNNSRRGAALLRMGHMAVRRDILTGTPMPQGSSDLQSQLDFLWPGVGLGSRISAGEKAKEVIAGLFVRTTKEQLGLEPRVRIQVPVSLTDAHLAFYSVLKDDVRAKASELRRGMTGAALIRARRMVIRLLQAAVNPQLVASSFPDVTNPERGRLLRAVIQEGPSARIREAAALCERLASEGRKVLVWTIFTQSLHQLCNLLEHLSPAVIYGPTGNGDESDDSTRQGQIRRFKSDPRCMVMIANPAAASEGMSLHMHCHDAIYVDRSYNATHFLQSIDRIHRLGLPAGVQTTVYVLENKLPFGVGSIDLSVARRLAKKIRGMEALLADPDLNALALDEEDQDGAIENSIDAADIDDLVAEIERSTGNLVNSDDTI